MIGAIIGDVVGSRFEWNNHKTRNLRVGEVLALRWQDVQLFRKRINGRNTVVRLANKKKSFVQDSVKSESSRRTIPPTAEAIEILEK